MKIFFNGTEYQIDDSVLQVAANRLKSYLSTDMYGSDATVDFDGESYDVDAAKLAMATGSLESYLRTIIGTDYKIVVNGVEYGVDSAKVARAITTLETILKGLSGEEDPEKNEHGFYYNVPYLLEYPGYGTLGWVFYQDYTVEHFYPNNISGIPYDLISTGRLNKFTYDESTRTATGEDGTSIVFNEDGKTGTSNGMVLTATGIEHGVYFGDTYLSESGDMLVFYSDGSATLTSSDVSQTIAGLWSGAHHLDGIEGVGDIWVSIDGESVFSTLFGTEFIALYKRQQNNVKDILDNEWPIEWNTMEVVNNTKFTDSSSGVTCVKISNLIPTSEELESIEILANINGITYTFTYTLKQSFSGGEFALYTCNELSMQTFLFSAAEGTSYSSGLYVIDFGSAELGAINADCVAKLTTPPSNDSLIHNTIAEGAYYANFNTGTFYNEMPETVSEGDAYLYGDYLYRYEPEVGGWAVSLAEEWLSAYIPYEYVDRNQSSYDDVLATINNVPVTCLGLQNPDGPQYLLNPTFDDCTNITSVGLPGSGASVEIPNSIIWLQGTFRSCTGLTTVTIPNSVSNIDSAFDGCTGLTSITFDGTIEQWNSISKDSVWNRNVPVTYVQCSDGQVSLV